MNLKHHQSHFFHSKSSLQTFAHKSKKRKNDATASANFFIEISFVVQQKHILGSQWSQNRVNRVHAFSLNNISKRRIKLLSPNIVENRNEFVETRNSDEINVFFLSLSYSLSLSHTFCLFSLHVSLLFFLSIYFSLSTFLTLTFLPSPTF